MWEQIRANQRRSAIMVILMAALLFLLGYFLGELFFGDRGGTAGLVIAFIVWTVLTMLSYFSGDSIFLSISGARKIQKQDHPVLFNIVEEMTIAAGLPKMPDVYIIDDATPNAFATGRKPDKAAVAVTAGLLEILDRDELQGVIAHEIGHIRNRDILYMMMVGIMMGTIVLLADIGIRAMFYGGAGRRRTSSRDGAGQAQAIIMLVAIVLMILAPIIAQLIYFTISRKREYLADAGGAQFTRYPEGLASALEKISGVPQKLKAVSRVTAPSYIINPLRSGERGLTGLFSTHPPTSERVKILRAMAGAADYGKYDEAYRKVTRRPVGVVPASALKAAQETPSRAAEKKDALSQLDRIRETTDMLWRLNQFIFIACACGTKLKIPPEYLGKRIECPHCGTPHIAKPPAA
jgi:heat shock protein HtpX